MRGGGLHVGCRLKFRYFNLSISVKIFDICLLSVNPS